MIINQHFQDGVYVCTCDFHMIQSFSNFSPSTFAGWLRFTGKTLGTTGQHWAFLTHNIARIIRTIQQACKTSGTASLSRWTHCRSKCNEAVWFCCALKYPLPMQPRLKHIWSLQSHPSAHTPVIPLKPTSAIIFCRSLSNMKLKFRR